MYKLEESERICQIEKEFGKSIQEILRDLHWEKNLKHSEIGEKINVPRSTVTKWFHHFGVPTQDCTRFTNLNLEKHREWLHKNKKPKVRKEFPWHFNKDFFKEWTEEMAYVLGLMISDGYVFTNPRGSKYFGITSTDREIVEKIKRTLDSNHKVGVGRPRRAGWMTPYVLQIGSKDVVRELAEFGIVQNKSLNIALPKNIPDNYLRDFVRGLFDGDGCVWWGYSRKGDRREPTLVLQVTFTSGSENLLGPLKDKLHHALNVTGSKYCFGGGYRLSYSIADSLQLYHFMYDDLKDNLFLTRKKEKFDKFISIYAGVA